MHNRQRGLFIISLAFFFAFVGTGASQMFIVDHLKGDRGFTSGQAALILAAVYFSFVVFRLTIGFIVNTTGLYLARIFGAATYMLLPLLLFLSAPYPALLMGSIVWGLGAPMLWTSSLVHVMNASAPTRFGAATGFVRGTATLAQLMGMYILGELYEWRGMEALFLFAIAGSGVAAAAMMVSPRGGFTAARPRWQSFVAVMRRPDTITMCALLLFSGLAYGIVLNRFKAHVESIHGPGGLSLVLPFFFIAAIASNYGGGALSDRWGRWTTIAGGYAVGAAGMLAAGIWTHTALMALALLCIGVLFAVVPLSGFAWVGDQTPPEDRASVMGYIFCFRDLGVAVGIMSASLFASSLTLFRAFGVFFLLCALAGFIMVRLQRTSAAA